MRARRFVLFWAVAGLIVPLLMLVSSSGGGGIFVVAPRVAIALWPFSLGLMALGPTGTGTIVMIAVTLALNVILYASVGGLIWLISGVFRPHERA